MITEEKITFDGCYQEKHNLWWQDVLHNGDVIAAICHRTYGILQPVEIWCQKLLPDTEIPFLKEWCESEDVGYVFGIFRDESLGTSTLTKYMNERGINQ